MVQYYSSRYTIPGGVTVLLICTHTHTYVARRPVQRPEQLKPGANAATVGEDEQEAGLGRRTDQKNQFNSLLRADVRTHVGCVLARPAVWSPARAGPVAPHGARPYADRAVPDHAESWPAAFAMEARITRSAHVDGWRLGHWGWRSRGDRHAGTTGAT